MNRVLMSLALPLVMACTPTIQEYDEYYGAGFINIHEVMWPLEYDTPYPFTVPSGEISCGFDPKHGRTVYFAPAGFTDESYIGTPLNQAASESLKNADMRPNVPYSIKKGTSLDTAIKIGLKLCDEQREFK